jgi:hypothetical protein
LEKKTNTYRSPRSPCPFDDFFCARCCPLIKFSKSRQPITTLTGDSAASRRPDGYGLLLLLLLACLEHGARYGDRRD